MIWLFYSIEILLSLLIIGLVLLQKGSDGIFARDSKMFGIRSRPNSMARLTYIITFIFLTNTFVLIHFYEKQYHASLLKAELSAKKNTVTTQEKQEKQEESKQAVLPEIKTKKNISPAKKKAKK